MIRTFPCVLGLFIRLMILPTPAIAQIDRASINGTVTDASGSVIQDAIVEIIAADTGFHRQTVSGPTGTYQIPGIAIGIYKVTFEKPGFRTSTVDRVSLSVGEARTIDARLDIGG